MPSPSTAEELKKLHDLKEIGALSDEEFASEKAKILGGGAAFQAGPSGPAIESAPATPVPVSGSEYVSYEEVPFYRRNWFMIVCFFICWPAIPIVVGTGEVYYVDKEGRLTTYTKGARIFLTVWGILVTLRLLSA